MGRSSHDCPGGCGKRVRRELLACSPCWWRLPRELRDAINLAYPRRSNNPGAHRAAIAAAFEWYRDHPEAANV